MLKEDANIPRAEHQERLILDNMKQVEIIAKRIHHRTPACVELGDLIGVGILGLIRAVERYNPDHGIPFKTYSEYRIRGAMLDSLRDLDWAPRNLRVKRKTMQNISQSFEQRLGRKATEEEICEALGIDIDKYHQLVEYTARMNVSSLEEFLNPEDPKHPMPSGIPSLATGENPSSAYEKQEICHILSECIDELPQKERLIVSLYYYEELTMAKISRILGVNESRVSQIHSHAMLRMRSRLHSVFAVA
jgi:RNA polymerase sigma factor FliA